MLHRSFKPAKCKTALKLAVSRIKLTKNKKEAVYKQQKREVSQLLESGQDRSARIRVEHVVREEKTMAAYELIEIYCELIVARLPIIESQKNCPIDLKEAITSVIFASPRCSDIPELMDIRKHFTAKYGKEFVSSAVELRPDCGVNRMLVEKLSAKAPDVQTKIKVLSAIAEEYNIKWDPNSLGEIDGKPTDDLLNGPKTFQNASKMYVEPPDVQAPQHRDQKHDVPVNPYEHNRNSSLIPQNFASTDVGTSKTTSSSARPEPRPSRTGAEGMESKHSFSGCANDSSLGRQNWNMEFKDATSAAQAAAESAERASMAARAAAELSSRGKITRQYSEEPQKSYVNGLGDEGQQTHAGSKLQSDNSVNNSFHATDSIHNGQIDGHEKDNQAGGDERFYSHSRKSSRSASLKSNTASPDDDTLVNSPQKADGYSQMSSSGVGIVKLNSGDFFAGAMKEQSSQSEGSEKQDGIKTDNFDSFGEERLRKQSSSASSHSHSSTLGDDHEFVSNTNQEKFENDIDQDLFVSVDQENIQTDTKQAHSYDHAALVFDDSGSDDDEGPFSVEDNYSRQESSFFTSPGRKSPICFSENTNTSISIENKSKSAGKSISQSHLFTELPEVSVGVTNSEVPSEPDDLLHVTFDHSDDSSSESEEELVKSKLGGMEYNAESQKRSGLGTSTNQRSPRLGKSQIGSGDMDKKSFYNEYDEEKSRQSFKHSAIHEIKNNVQTVETPHAMKDDEFLNQSSLDDSKEFNFGVLAGGLRNKGYRHPPYTRGPSSDSSSSSNPAVEETSATILEFPNSQSQKVGTKGDKELNTRAAVSSSDSDTDDFNQEPTSQKAGESLSSETSSKIQGMYFDSDTGDLKEDFPKQNLASKGRLGSGFSRRTRGSPSLSEKSSYPKVKVSAEMSVSSDHGAESRPSKISHATEKPRSSEQATSKPTPELNNSLHEERLKTSAIEKPSSPFSAEGSVSYGHGTERRPSKISFATEKPSSTEQATSKSMPELRNSLHEERLKTPAMEKPSSSFSGNTESSKFSSSREKIPSTENSIKKASHVHPKLPDYDSITAHLQSLRSNKK